MPLFGKFKPGTPLPSPPPPNVLPSDLSSRSDLKKGTKHNLLHRLRDKFDKPDVPSQVAPNAEAGDLSDGSNVQKPSMLPHDPEKDLKRERRARRRAERQKKEEEHRTENEQRQGDANLTNLPYDPLPPLSPFDSASEDERETPQPVHPQVVAEGIIPEDSSIRKKSDTQPSQLFDPPVAQKMPEQSFLDMPTPPASGQLTYGTTAPNMNPNELPTLTAPHPTLARNPDDDARLADQFGAVAYSISSPSAHLAPRTTPKQPQPSPLVPPQQPSPIGWGGVYDSAPPQAVYGTPVHLQTHRPIVMQVDPMLSEQIQRGRELAMLAIEQEEKGNLGAARSGYIKALEILVPASKQLEAGSELNKTARMQLKEKIRREAHTMADRCEELGLFLRANGPQVPKELPRMPTQRTEITFRGLEQPAKGNPQVIPAIKPVATASPGDMSFAPLPLSAPNEAINLSDSGSLLLRMKSRTNVLANTNVSGGVSTLVPPTVTSASMDIAAKSMPPDITGHSNSHARSRGNIETGARSMPPDIGVTMRGMHIAPNPPPQVNIPPVHAAGESAVTCFMCEAPAHFRTQCEHYFCSNCGNQLVTVFGSCPVPGCGNQISIDAFEHIMQ